MIISLKKEIKTVVSAITAVAMMFTIVSIPHTETSAESNCIINTDTKYQTIKGFGGMNHPEWTGKDLTDAQRQTAFGNGDNELGMSVVRVYVNDDPNQWYKAVPTAKDVIARGGIVFATPWNPPADMCETFTRTYTQWWDGKVITQENQKRLRHDKYAEYAEHLNNFVHYMKDNGVDLYAISIQNEPDYGEDWTWMTSDECVDFLENYADKIDCPVMSPESFSYNKEYYNKILESPKAYANTDIFGTHFYGTSRDNMDFPALEQCGKEIFMTEVYTDSKNDADLWPMALDVSENIHDGLVVGNMNAYVWWYIRRSYSPMKEDGTISKRGYCMAQYSKFVRPGYVRVDATEQPDTNIKVSAYTDNDKLVVVAINSGTDSIVQEFSFENETVSQVERYRTSASENLLYTGNMELSGDGFFATLPAESVTTFVADIKESNTDPVTPDENGYYFHDDFETTADNWSARGTNKIGLSGRTPYMGTNALVVSERTASWNGAEKALDTSVFKAGTAYSFSTCVKYIDGDDTEDFALTLQYTDENGDTRYSRIASATAVKNYYVQLSNTNYTIPENASDIKLVVETASGTMNFYIDEAIGAVAGTVIEGPEPATIPATTQTTSATTTTTTTTTTKTTTANTLAGDVNLDGKVNIADAISLAAFVGEPDKNPIEAQGIINGDIHNSGDGITSGDVLMIQQYIAQIITDISPSVPETDPAQYMNIVRTNLYENESSDSTEEKSGVEYGNFEKVSYYSDVCKRNKNFNVLLPAGYTTDKKYPVLYVLHGYWGDENALLDQGDASLRLRQIIGNAIADGEAEEMIVVFPDIYASDTQDKCDGLNDKNNAAYDNFINVLTKEIMPYMQQNYSIKTGRENTAITGFSMGGRESLYISFSRPDLFGYMGAMCPAPGLTTDLIADGDLKFSDNYPYLLMISAGSDDQIVWSTPSGYHNTLNTNNVDHVWHYVTDGDHGGKTIRPHIYNFIRYIFKA